MAERLSLEPELQHAVLAVIHALDADGYLRTDVSALGPAALVDAAVQIVQRLDPPGVGARTLSECLCLQLQALGESGLACTIAEHYLEQAGHHAFAAIAASEHVPLAAVQEAYRQIQSLSPYPCAEFSRAQDDGYVVPDVLLQEKDGVLSVAVNRAYTPELSVSSFYRSLVRETDDPEARQYIVKKVSQAEWLISCIRQREETLLRCCQEILKRQLPYFRSGQALAPMTMQDIAQAVGLHTSTVSRALSGKYIQTPQGVRLLRSLFSAKLAGGEVSGVMAQQAIAVLVQQEDKHAPLSDQALAERLQVQGIDISRRTVAKYRQLLQIPSAATAGVLVVVGCMMASSLKEIDWGDISEAVPAFFASVFMAFSYSISYGIAGGFITYCLIKTCKGKAKEVHPVIWVVSLLFILDFIITAIL